MDAKVSEPAAAPVAPHADPEPLSHSERRIIVMSMMLPVFLGSVDQSILASSLPTIGRVFGNVHDLPWVITSYLIAATALTPLYGKFADIHGRRASLLIALGIYMTGAFISASSQSLLMLIFGRVVQGCGGGGLTASAQMVLGDIASPKDRAKYYTYFSIAFTTAGGCGPALGGWICDHLSWWMIFIWKIPLCIIAGILALTMLRRLPFHGRRHRLDFVGAVLIMAASSSFMLALNVGGVRYPWLSAPVIALVGCALLLGAAFVARLLTAAEPLIPIAILADPAARLAMLTHSFGWGSILGLNIFLPMYLQNALGWSPTDSGVSLMILMVTLNTSAGFSSQLIGRVKHYKLLPTVFLVIAIGAVLALAFSAAGMSSLRFEIILFLIGIGFGPMAPLTQVALQNTVAIHHLGSAIGTMNFVRTLMSTIVVAAFGAIVLATLPVAGPADTLGQRAAAATSVAPFVAVFLAAAGTLTVALIALIRLEEKPLEARLPGARS
jgi:MFS family permease